MNQREKESLENVAAINIDIVTKLSKEHSVSEETAAMCLLAAQIRSNSERREKL